MAQANSLLTGRPVFKLHIGPQELSWEIQKRTEKSSEGGGRTIRFEFLESGKAALKDPETIREKVAGVQGVIPRGRLAGLMKFIKEDEHKDRLCWAVLRRYADHHDAGAKVEGSICTAAFGAIKRAWERARVEKSLCSPPPDFFSGNVPSSDEYFWLLDHTLRLDAQGMEIYIGWKVHQLLNPAIRPLLQVLWIREL